MTVFYVDKDAILGGKDPDILGIEALQRGPTPRNTVNETLKKGPQVWSKYQGKPRSNRTFNNWIDRLVERGIVEVHGEVLKLSTVGEWIANSHLGTISQRISLATSMICERCRTTRNRIVLVEPAYRGKLSKGRFKVDGRCPECGECPGPTTGRREWSKIPTEVFPSWDEFNCLYQMAKREMGSASR